MLFQPVRGTHDILPSDMRRINQLLYRVRDLVNRYGFEEIATPIFEFAGVFHRLGASSDIVTKETYTFQDRGGAELTLRPEGTAGVVRALLSNGLGNQLPLKYFYAGPMFRYERPQKGRYRQFDQIGVEFLGIKNPLSDVEVIAIAIDVLDQLEIASKVALEINTIGNNTTRQVYNAALVEYFTKYHSSLSPDSQRRLQTNPLRILDSKDEHDRQLIQDAPHLNDYLTKEARCYFEAVCQGLSDLNISFTHNNYLVRGLDYYCHTAFEITSKELGAQGAVIAGGRYDGLAEQLGGPHIPAVGWAGSIDRMLMLSSLPIAQSKIIALVATSEEYEIYALKLSRQLNKLKVRVETIYDGNLAKRLKKAARLQANWAILLGENEINDRKLTIRNLQTGYQEVVALDKVEEYFKELLNLIN